MLMTLAEKTMLPPSRHLYGYVGLTSQYALMGLYIKISLGCLDDHCLLSVDSRALEDADESEHEARQSNKDHRTDKRPVKPLEIPLSSTEEPAAEPQQRDFGDTRRPGEHNLEDDVEFLHGR